MSFRGEAQPILVDPSKPGASPVSSSPIGLVNYDATSTPLLQKPPSKLSVSSNSSLESMETQNSFTRIRARQTYQGEEPPTLNQDAHTGNRISSLDFERVINEYSIQATRDRYHLDAVPSPIRSPPAGAGHVQRLSTLSDPLASHYEETEGQAGTQDSPKALFKTAKTSTGRTATRWAMSTIIGLCTGLITILIVQTTGSIVRWRTETLDAMAQSKRFPNLLIFFGFVLVNLVLAVSASYLCVQLAPEGAGSGIPEVQAYLNGVRVKKFTSWQLLGVKIIGTILSVSSSLAIGMEGPLVHIGAITGASFTKIAGAISRFVTHVRIPPATTRWLSPAARQALVPLKQSLLRFTTTNLAHFSIDAERRDFISIGASVGFAASFGAPIGGLLFVLYDISSYFSKTMFLRTLVANAIGTFCLALQSGNLSNYSIINLSTYRGANEYDDIFLERFEYVPLYIFVGVAGGALGGIFSINFVGMKKHVASRFTTPYSKLLEVALLSAITSTCLFGLPTLAWTCQVEDLDDEEVEHGKQFFCGPGEVNEMATILFGSRDDAIKRILSDPSDFQQRTLWTVGILFYALMTITSTSTIPSGIFTPTVLSGASLGGALGLALQDWIGPDIIPESFALLGVAAMLAGIQRSTLSICVILVEGTGQMKVLLPSIIVVLVARAVAEKFHTLGFFETAMELKHYPYLGHEERRRYDIFQVRDIMTSPVDAIGPSMKASALVKLLKSTPHNGYPVVDPVTKKFLGLVRRDQIVALLECGVLEETDPTPSIGATKGSIAGSEASSVSSLKPGVANSPLMLWAYHIKDDRYDYIKNSGRHDSLLSDKGDEFDRHEWLRSIRQSVRDHVKSDDQGDVIQRSFVSTAGDDSMPALRQVITSANSLTRLDALATDSSAAVHSRTPSSSADDTAGFAQVGIDEAGNLYISWLNPDFRNHYVNLGAVMNQGTFSVSESLPVSRARVLFTQLGLRHVVVLGGISGGEVVGIFTRANLMPSFIAEKTGVVFQ